MPRGNVCQQLRLRLQSLYSQAATIKARAPRRAATLIKQARKLERALVNAKCPCSN